MSYMFRTTWGLVHEDEECFNCFCPNQEKKTMLCSASERQPYWIGMIWVWLNDDRIEIFGWINYLRELLDNIKGQTKLYQWGDSPMGHKRWLRKEMGREPDLVEAQCLLSFTHYKWESSSAAPNLFMIDCSLELFTTKEVWTFGENPSSRHPHTHPHFNTKGSFPPQEMKFEMTSGHTSTAAPLFLPMYTLALSLKGNCIVWGSYSN